MILSPGGRQHSCQAGPAAPSFLRDLFLDPSPGEGADPGPSLPSLCPRFPRRQTLIRLARHAWGV
jgi:hypothetical protein